MNDHIPLDSADLFYEWLESVREGFYESDNLKQTLKLMKQKLSAQLTSEIIESDLPLSESKIFKGSLQVQGDIVLPGSQEMLIVAGDLAISGDLIALGSDYSLVFVGGNLKCSNLATNGELVVFGNVDASNLVLGVGNNYSSVGTILNSDYLVLSDDRADFFETLNVKTKIEEFALSIGNRKLISKALENVKIYKTIVDFYVDRGCEWKT